MDFNMHKKKQSIFNVQSKKANRPPTNCFFACYAEIEKEFNRQILKTLSKRD